MEKSRLALIKCTSYNHEELAAALQKGFELLGGIEKYVTKDEKILLKPNLLSADISSKYTTTSPDLFQVVAESLFPYTCNIKYGDAPATQPMIYVADRCGIGQVAKKLGVAPADFLNGINIDCPPDFKNKRFFIAKGVTEADNIISLSRLKTHGLTRMTGAVKNQFGYMPGILKASYHARIPDVGNFCKMMVELNLLYRPKLYIMDAIMAMEGNGPGNGTGKKMSLLLMSADPVAVDATACRLIDLNPQYVLTNVWGHQLGLGHWQKENIEILGENPDDYIDKDFKVSRQSLRPPFWAVLFNSVGKVFMRKPYIDKDVCVNCGLCVKVCPVSPKALYQPPCSPTPVYDYSKCIRCFCCQELCPHGAVKIKKSFSRK
jgi:uncharacterized protein (DUF362 family)/Pyruvate/2-oxoacid:ferredoxin oxidoreductase delta subunit